MDIFQRKGAKVTVAYSLTESTVEEIEKIAEKWEQKKSAVVDQLLKWGLERYAEEASKRRPPRSSKNR